MSGVDGDMWPEISDKPIKAPRGRPSTETILNSQLQAYKDDVRNEVKAKIEVLDKLIMGAGEYHDDPTEYVVPLRHIKEYRDNLAEFDLAQPIYRDTPNIIKGEV